MPVTRDQLAGCLIGQCLGDALGFPMEGEGAPDCAAWARDWVRAGRVPPRGAAGFPFGQYTDGSQLARELLASWAARGGFDPEDYAGRISRLYQAGEPVGRGHCLEQAAARLAAGVPWRQAGTPPPGAGNGSALRAAPLGVLLFDDPEAMVRAALEQSLITHADPRCLAGAVAVAGAVAIAARGQPIRPHNFLSRLREWVGRIEPTMETSLRRLEGWLTLPPEEAVRHMGGEGMPPGVDSQWRGGVSAFVVGSVLWALYAFLRSPDDYLETVATAIEPGGDVDTTAAMAGAMAGARLGLDALPAELAGHLADRGRWDYGELVGLAFAAFDAGWQRHERRQD